MRYLFIDNFRGFKETALPIRDVNFFVGENSTGKTSIMSLIKLMSSSHFWFRSDFRSEEVGLGTFNDIVSVNSSDRSYFRIGYMEVPQRRPGVQGFLCTFKQEEGMPKVSDYTTLAFGEQVRFNFNASACRYKFEGPLEVHDDIQFIRTVFLDWTKTHREISTKYRKYRGPIFSGDVFGFIPDILQDILRERGTTDLPKAYHRYTPRPFGSVVWLAPIRTRPQRTYDRYRLDFSPEGEHTPYIIKKFLARRTREQQEAAREFTRFIQKFGRDSGLFKSITIKDYDPGIVTSPFELDIILDKEALSIENVGYGISQALPVIVEIFIRAHGSWFALQQPEIHLHPRAQVAIGDLIFELSCRENKKFIVETHSDFILDGYRLSYERSKHRRKPDAQIVFFERTRSGNCSHQIEILENGEISDRQPKAYREFFLGQEMRLLGLSDVYSD